MNPIIIPNFSRRSEFIQMLNERGAKLGVEVGTDHGKYAQQLLEGIPGLKLYCIDPWIAYTEGAEHHSQEEVDKIYKEAKDRLLERTSNGDLQRYSCSIIRDTSMQALQDFSDNSLDFVFIDGNHSYDYVLEDITEWTKKVKPGGIVSGHDYKVDPENNYGVIEAIQKYVKDNHIAPWFVFQKRGLVDCFMFIKQP